jgi:hypothetical protein
MGGEGEKKYNRVFERLASDENGLAGLVAYALYKRDKRQWLLDFKANRGRDATDAEVNERFDVVTEYELNRYIAEARQRLATFATQMYRDTVQETVQSALDASILNEVKTANQRFLRTFRADRPGFGGRRKAWSETFCSWRSARPFTCSFSWLPNSSIRFSPSGGGRVRGDRGCERRHWSGRGGATICRARPG